MQVIDTLYRFIPKNKNSHKNVNNKLYKHYMLLAKQLVYSICNNVKWKLLKQNNRRLTNDCTTNSLNLIVKQTVDNIYRKAKQVVARKELLFQCFQNHMDVYYTVNSTQSKYIYNFDHIVKIDTHLMNSEYNFQKCCQENDENDNKLITNLNEWKKCIKKMSSFKKSFDSGLKLIENICIKFSISQEACVMAIELATRYLMKCYNQKERGKTNENQLSPYNACMIALFIAGKIEMVSPLSLHKYADEFELSSHTIKEMEITFLTELKFKIFRPRVLEIIDLWAHTYDICVKSKDLITKAVLNGKGTHCFLSCQPSVLAAAVLMHYGGNKKTLAMAANTNVRLLYHIGKYF
jgi:hypothetical protein